MRIKDIVRAIDKGAARATERATSGARALLNKKVIKNRQVIKESNRPTVVVSQPDTDDKSRYFKKAWEVQKRQLYFD